MQKSYLVISNRKNVDNAAYFKSPAELEAYLKLNPKAVLIFAFWSWIVPKWMLDTFKCYGLHTGPLLEGKGKGGSPIDNLKKLGVTWTTLCAFEMNEKIDGGRVVVAIPLRITDPTEYIVGWIDGVLPRIVKYLTTVQPEIPERFQRLK